MLGVLIAALCLVEVAVVRADFETVVYSNSSIINYITGSWTQDQANDGSQSACTPVIYNGGVWNGGPLPILPMAQTVGQPPPLPITFGFSFTGTEFNVVGNDWRDGLVTFTLDGVNSAPYDLGSATNNTGARCRFPWYTQTGLDPTVEHSFQMSLTAPSTNVVEAGGVEKPGSAQYYGLQFFYFSYTPLPQTTNTSAPTSATSTAAASHSSAAAIGGGVAGGVVVLILLGFLVWYCVRRKDRHVTVDPVDIARNSNWDNSSFAPQVTPMATAGGGYYVSQPASYDNPTGYAQYQTPTGALFDPHHSYQAPSQVYSGRNSSFDDATKIHGHQQQQWSPPSMSRSMSPRSGSSYSPEPSEAIRPQSLSMLSEADLMRVARTVAGMLPGGVGGGGGGGETALPSVAPPPLYQRRQQSPDHQ